MPEMDGARVIYSDFTDLIPGENPLYDGGKWANHPMRPPLMVQSPAGSSIHGTVEFPPNGSIYVAEAFSGPIIEAYACTPNPGLGAAIESQRILALIGNPYEYTGYLSGYGGGIGENYFMRKYNGGTTSSWDNLGGDVGGTRPDKLGIRLTPTHVEQWAYYGGVWNLIQSHPDTAHRGTTYFMLETEEQGGTVEVGFTCFGAGIPNKTQIYRWVSN